MMPFATDDVRVPGPMGRGNTAAAECLLPLVYRDLRDLAAAKLSHETPGQTLQPTALVHEAYLRLVRLSPARRWDNTGHFFAAAAEAMRRILIENARRKLRARHGGGRRRVDADPDALAARESDRQLLALHEALEQFATREPLKAKLVELRFFGGLTLAQAAEVLDISLSTADRGWRFARAWLYAAMVSEAPGKK